MAVALTVLSVLVLSYSGLLILVNIGMFRSGPAARRQGPLPAVSVILPAHNEEERLPATLRSLAAQEYAGPLEFVIVDDRSSDLTPVIIDSWAERDPRFRRHTVTSDSRRFSPKVNAVNSGIAVSTGEIVITTDADCSYPDGWVEGMVSHFSGDTVMVVGYVETTRAWQSRSPVQLFEATDWLSLMLTSRSLARYGWKFTSSANNQAYLRSAFDAAGGFGAGGRAPSGDEDLLVQRLGRLPGARVVFADDEQVRVLTRPVDSWKQLLNQRRRWVSRYHHPIHYRLPFLLSITVLGLQSIALSLALLLLPWFPGAAPVVLSLWAFKLTVELTGMYIGTRQLGRADLYLLPSLGWALLHPFFIAAAVIMSFVRPGDWRGGNRGYRTRFLRRRWNVFRRRVRTLVSRA